MPPPAIQAARLRTGNLHADRVARIGGGEVAHVGDVVATRRNDRHLLTTSGRPVRNRDTWTITAIDPERDAAARTATGAPPTAGDGLTPV